MKPLALARALPFALTLCAASLVGACSSPDGILPTFWSPQQGHQDKRDTPNSEKAVKLPLAAAELQCPPIEIDEGGAAARVGGPDNASVRYQFDIGQTARECAPLSDNQFSLKVGVLNHLPFKGKRRALEFLVVLEFDLKQPDKFDGEARRTRDTDA